MAEIVTVVLAVLAITGLGWLLLLKNVNGLSDRRQFAVNYMDRLRDYIDSGGRDGEAYAWLTHRANKIQKEMGSYGVMKHFQRPYSSVMFNNYPIVLNVLPEIRSHIDDPVMGNLVVQYANALQEAFLRYLGALDDALEDARSDLRNPIISFRQGVQTLLLAPKYLLHWLRIARRPSLYSRGALVTIMSGVVALVGLLAAVITIAIGWEEFSAIVMGLLGHAKVG